MSSNTIAKTSAVSAQSTKIPNMVAIASGKGGVGKTFISATLAHALSTDHKRVLLFDGDLGLANIDVQLGLMPPYDLGSVIAGHVSLEEAICRFEDPGQGKESGFDILAGKSGSGSLGTLSKAQLQGLSRGLKSLSPFYDLMIIDLPAGIDNSVTHLSALCKTVYVVLTDEPTSLTDAYAYIKVISRSDPHAKFQIIVNQTSRKADGERVFGSLAQACQNFLNISLDHIGTVRRDNKVRDAIRHQMPILQRSPESYAASDLSAIAKTMI